MQLRTLFLFALGIIPHIAVSQQVNPTYDVKGTILDAATKEQLIGATLSITELKRNTSARLDGTFSLEHIQPGTYHLRCTYIGYASIDTVLTISGNMKINLLMKNTSAALNEITVKGKQNAESEAAAKKSEQNAVSVQNIISAKAIELSPDITVANVLQRISGVSVERGSDGEARYAIIRGMEPRYNNTLINGVKIASPDNKSRFIPLDIFPSDLIERIEVNKTLTPNMEGDAIGGTVNMVMKNAPDNLYVNASVATGVSQNVLDHGFESFPVSAIHKKSPYQANGPAYSATPDDFTRDNLNYTHKSAPINSMATLSIGNRFFKDRLGVMLGGSYQNIYKSYTSIFNPGEFQEGGQVYIKHSKIRDYSSQLTRMGLNAKLDYNFNKNNKISLYTVYADLKDAQARLTTDTIALKPRTVPGTGQVWNFGRSKYQHQSIFNTTLQGQHTILPERLKFNWSAVYSKADNQIPDMAEYEYDGGFFADGTNAAPYQHLNAAQNYDRTWWRNNDRDLTGYLNLDYSAKAFGIPFTATAGGMYRDKRRVSYYDSYEIRPVLDAIGNPQEWKDIYSVDWTVYNPNGTESSFNNYRVNEKISAGYGMIRFVINKLETTGGIRVESTDQHYETDAPETSEGKTGSKSYMDILPSVNFKYALNDKTNLRLAYYAAIARPSFFEIVPYKFPGEEWDEIGNAKLQHSTSENFDLRYELFPKANEQFFVGAFYKVIHKPIEYGFDSTLTQGDLHLQPNNYGDATNYGFEVVYEKYIGNFGIRANYTYTHSSITTVKSTSAYVDGVLKRFTPEEERPLQGQAAHVANAALLYKNTKLGLDVQLAWQYTGKRIALVYPKYGFDYWQKGMSIFDISAEKRIAKHFSVFAKVQNLLNARYEAFINKPYINDVPAPFQDPSSGKTLVRRDQYGQNYLLGIRFLFKK